MVQVLPYVPGFGEKLGQAFGSAIGQFGQAYQQRRAQSALQRLLQPQQEMGADSPMDQMNQAVGQISPESNALKVTQLYDLAAKAYGPEQAKVMANAFIEQQKIVSKDQRVDRKEALKKQEEHEDISGTINDLADELMKGDVGFWNQWNKAFSGGRQSRAYFDELALNVEKRLATMVGKGALNKERFKYLVSKLPQSDDSDAKSRGKLKALVKEFQVDIKNPEFRKAAGISEPGKTWVISPSGKQVEIDNSEVEAALASGGKLG